MLHAVVMAGGSGTRFWPQSRRARPKQLLPLAGPRTMIQDTVARVEAWIPPERTWIVTGAALAEETLRQLPHLPADQLLIEPCGRNTAPCVGLAAVRLLAQDAEAVMLVMPADHVIRPDEDFRRDVEHAAGIVNGDPRSLVLFGVPPTYPATGFGYIERGEALAGVRREPADASGASRPPLAGSAWHVASFREKPDRPTAETYLGSGRFYWNCGIFVWRADQILAELACFEPELHTRLMRLRDAAGTPQWQALLSAEFPPMQSISIDYAVLERANAVRVVEARFEWDDVGSWPALARLLGADADGNTIDGPFCGVSTRGCTIRSAGDGHLIATAGVDDLVIVHMPDATLVARRDDENGLRELIERLKSTGLERYL